MRDHHSDFPPSSFPMLARCPCYRSGEPGEAAKSGTRQHLLLESLLRGLGVPEGNFDCTDAEREQVEWAASYISSRTSERREVEKRFSLVDDNFEDVTFGTIDVVDIVPRAAGDVLCLFDYKSGNDHGYLPQMAVYARMAMIACGKTMCEVHEVYGRTRNANQYTLTMVETNFINDIVARVKSGNKKPVLNEFCSWCEKHGTCPATTEAITRVATEYEPASAIAEIPFNQIQTWHASEITEPAQMAIVLRVAEYLGKWADAVKAHAREAAIKGMEIPGYVLKNGRRTRMFSDLNVVYEVSGLPASEFLSCCTASVPEIEKSMARKNGHKSSTIKAAKEDFDKLLGDFVVFKDGAPILALAKEN